MNVAQALAAILKKEGVEFLFCYPNNKVIDEAALLGIRPIVVRQERSGLHMADAISKLSSGARIGVFASQHGPGAENAYGSVAQSYGDSVPVLVLPQGYPRHTAPVKPNFSAAVSMRDVSKIAEALLVPDEIPNVMRRAFSALRNGRGGPAVVEVPKDLWAAELSTPETYTPVSVGRYGPDPADVERAVDLLVAARAPAIHAGQGVHYAKAWPELLELAELLRAPVATTLAGKSAFPEDHPLALGSGGLAYPQTVKTFLGEADVILGVGCSFTETSFAFPIPAGPRIVHLTLDPDHLNKDVRAEVGLIGDAKLALRAIIDALRARHYQPAHADPSERIAQVREAWLAQWAPKLDSDASPISPYRVVRELIEATKNERVIMTHDAGRPRDQLTPFWISREPLSFLGWGKTTQLGYGLPLIMGAKLAHPEKLCINVWGDAAIGFTGTDLETAAREKIGVLSILLNNQGMATELLALPSANRLYNATDISGHYAQMATALGCYAERITEVGDIAGAIARGIEKTREGIPVLLEFMTEKETSYSQP
ncbi:thiamine pyrophosphate-requiring protein [Hydrogenophaga sp.]|uniref:thiamine pyrophosphate-requiring protein n=1 Tax=Hydrogenophaga sp. TaxID=1904254 RepID=UPI0027246F04|nr:thiamine pyrophosphate-requiring protein [Hydrogenophaga sp.]MDO9435716.1 thiamine pyrophosphate-requiring protein [Hydrogenophaga sp.]